MNPVIIGEGSFGCIHKPSLRCKQYRPKKFYTNRVSKMLHSQEALEELKEYVAVQNADPHSEYYIGKPDQCSLNYKTNEGIKYLSDTDIDAVSDCKYGVDAIGNPDKFKLLIMSDGGISLKQYANELALRSPTKENIEKNELFWIEVLRLFMGISVFLNNDLVHHDIKPHNITYKEESNRVNYIDFGLMRRASEMISTSNLYSQERWFNFPIEVSLWEKDLFELHTTMRKKTKSKKFNKELQELIEGQTHNAIHMQTFMTYVINPNATNETRSNFLYNYLYNYFTCTDEYTSQDIHQSYKLFVTKSVETFDIYGLGMTLLYVFNHCEHLFPKGQFWKYDILLILRRMISSDRPRIEDCIDEYEYMLSNSGLLVKHNKRIENHRIVDGTEPIFSIIQGISVNDILLSEKKADAIAAVSPIHPCPEDKEYNPKTKKCVPKCGAGYFRNMTTFRCNKEKTARAKTRKSVAGKSSELSKKPLHSRTNKSK